MSGEEGYKLRAGYYNIICLLYMIESLTPTWKDYGSTFKKSEGEEQ